MTSHTELARQVRDRLSSMNDGQRAMFACAVAERLMRQHEALRPHDQRPFTISLRPLLNAAWAMACGDRLAFDAIKRGLGSFYLSDYCHNDGPEGPDDADDDAAAAVLYAAEYAMHGCLEFAACAAGRGSDAADVADQDAGAPPGADSPGELAREEFRRQLADLDFLEQHADDLRFTRLGRDIDTITRLEQDVKAPLSTVRR